MNGSVCLLFSLVMLMITGNIAHADRNILWKKINEGCVPEYLNKDLYRPCRLVDMNKKIIVYKVDNDKYQYLLLPTDKITGVEDSDLLKIDSPNYLYDAWFARTFLTERLGKPLKERFISLALNSTNARSQDQLHVHISCLSKSANEILTKIPNSNLTEAWSKEKVTIPPYHYFYRKISLNELEKNNLFKSISDKVKQENGSLEYTGVGLVNINRDNFILLVGIGTSVFGVSAESIQDHECGLAE